MNSKFDLESQAGLATHGCERVPSKRTRKPLIAMLALALGVLPAVQAQDAKNPYPAMAPLDQYLMDRSAEIALARSSAPEALSRDATVLVLGMNGYETAIVGKNGSRAWLSARGCHRSTARIFGTRKFAARSATIRRP